MNNVRSITVVLAVALVMLGAWFVYRSFGDHSSLGIDGDYGYFPVEQVGPLSVTEVIVTKHEDVADTNGCDVRLLYPQIAESDSVKTEARDKMNSSIVGLVRTFFSQEAESLDSAAAAFAAECKTDLTDLVTTMDDPIASAQEGWVSEIGYDIKQNEQGVFSVGISNYLSLGGAHPNITALYVTFDARTGEILPLSSFIPDDKVISQEVAEKQWLLDNQQGNLFEESVNEFQAFVTAPTIEAAKTYRDDATFYVTPTNIVIFYNPYSIAPYTSGPIEVNLDR
jgi:hypothetical protein